MTAPGRVGAGGYVEERSAEQVVRPSRQSEKRSEILDAAIALIEGHDLASLRLADVAAALGLTTNALRYYYKDMSELLSALALRSDVRFYDDRIAINEQTPDPARQLAQTIAAGLPTGPEDGEWRAIWRAVLTAGFELDQRLDVQGIYHRQVGLYADLLTSGADAGAFVLRSPARDIAVALMSMEDYLGYRIVARDPDIDRPTALRVIREYAELVTGTTLPEIL